LVSTKTSTTCVLNATTGTKIPVLKLCAIEPAGGWTKGVRAGAKKVRNIPDLSVEGVKLDLALKPELAGSVYSPLHDSSK